MHSLLAIYPTADKVESLLKRESRVKGPLLGHRVTTFPQVTEALWREAAVPRRTVTSIGERLALEEAINNASARGNLPFTPGVGLRRHLLRFIRELKGAALDAEALRDAASELPDGVASRIQAIADIFAEYDGLLQQGDVADAHDRERFTLEWLHRAEEIGPRPHFLNGVERLLVAEVYDPSLLQFLLVSSLIRLIGDAILTIQAEPFDLRVSRFAELTWNRFVGEESISDQVLPDFVRRGGRSGRLGFVLTELFARPFAGSVTHPQLAFPFGKSDDRRPRVKNKIPPPDGTIRIVEAPNPKREVEEVARSIRKMLEMPTSEQIALDRIGIVARNLTAYGEYLKRAFSTYHIPLDLVRWQPLSAFAPARVIRDLLRIPLQGYHRDNLLSLCRAPFLKLAAIDYPELLNQVGYIDRKTRPLERCIELRRIELADSLERKTEVAEREKFERRLARLETAAHCWLDLLELLKPLESPATIADYAQQTLRILDRLGFEPVRDSLLDSAAAVAGPLGSTLEALAREANLLMPKRRTTLTEFARIVAQTFDETTVDLVTDHVPGGVRAMSVADARGLDFEVVFIIGLNDGEFPIYWPEDPLVPDEVIRKLNRPLREELRRRMGRFAPGQPGPILRTHRDRNAEEPFLFFLAMSMPARAVVLSYSAADGAGNPLTVSPFVAEVSRILNDAAPEKISADQFIPSPSDCFSADEFLARAALDSALSQPDASQLAKDSQIDSILRRTEIERERERYFAYPAREELVDQRRRQHRGSSNARWLEIDLSGDTEKRGSATIYDGRLTPNSSLQHFLLAPRNGKPREWSAAQLSEQAACGFKFFARRVLLLREAEEPDYEQSALETGSFVHEILHAIFTRANLSNPDLLRTTAQRVLNEFHDINRLTTRDPAFFDLEWLSIESMVNEVIAHELAREIDELPSEMLHEFRLNFPLELRLEDNQSFEIGLVGQLDRLEIYRDAGRVRRFKIVDYKTSRRLNDYAELLKPEHFACEDLQMPVYALGVTELLRSELSAQATVQASYIALKNRDKETEPQTIPLELLKTAGAKTVAARITDLIATAAEGRFEVDPLECSDYCPYRRVCRYRKPLFDS